MAESEYQIVEGVPSVEDYQKLRSAVSWGNMNSEAVAVGLAHSLYTVYVLCNGTMVGFGRVVGDAATAFYLQDIIVRPDHQGRGVGKMIMDAAMAYIARHASTGAYVALMAAKGKEGFYLPYGFEIRPNERVGAGMWQSWK